MRVYSEITNSSLLAKTPFDVTIEQIAEVREHMPLRYSMFIQWFDEDQSYLVILPEWADTVIMPATHGSTYSEAVQNGLEVLEMLVNDATKNGEPLPPPKIYA